MQKKANKLRIKNISITYPPFDYNKQTVFSHSDSEVFFNIPTYSYPMVSSSAATLLKNSGYNVHFLDAMSENISTIKWFDIIKQREPDIILLVPSTPIINYYYDVINSIKSKSNDIIVVLAGQHVSALPNEAFEKSNVDYVLTGCDYDLIFTNLVNNLNGKEKLGSGIYRKVGNKVKFSGIYKNKIFLDNLPYIDRDLTNYKLYSKNNIAFKRNKATYIYTSRESYYESAANNKKKLDYKKYYNMRSPSHVFDEIVMLNKRYGINEIMDISEEIPTDQWLDLFSQMMIESSLNKSVLLNCNMRINMNDEMTYKIMKKAGFRSIYFNIDDFIRDENATDGIGKKCINDIDIIDNLQNISRIGLHPHISLKVGYPNDTEQSMHSKLSLFKTILHRGYASSISVMFVAPYPYTPLYNYAKDKNLLCTEKWSKYNMFEPTIKMPIEISKINEYMNKFVSLMQHPRYIRSRIRSLRDIDDIKYYYKLLRNIYSIKYTEENIL